ncbi:major capsid protein [Streptomyces longwoodensis]|uniref:major capsid protein n=1 Tax=Streptomyces longwoodensis TaxID=68231 RepID=UPI0037010C1D
MDLTAFARAIPCPKDFLLTQTIFPKVEMREVKWRTKDSGRYVNVAKYRAFNASVPFATREAWQTSREGALPALGQKLVVSEQEQILLEASHGWDQDRLIELLYDDVERHVEAIRFRLELAAGDVLVDGRFRLEQENGLTLEVDWNVPAENMPVARIPWSDPASDPIADELRWIQHLDDIGAPEPELVITSRKAFSYLAANNAYRAAYYGSVNPSTNRRPRSPRSRSTWCAATTACRRSTSTRLRCGWTGSPARCCPRSCGFWCRRSGRSGRRPCMG